MSWTIKLMRPTFLFISLLFHSIVWAQPAGWSHKATYAVTDTQNRTDYQVLFVINTDSLITLGQLNADASDLRFASDCDGTTLLDYYIDGTPASAAATVWVKMDLVAATAVNLFMFYGNNTATSISDFDALFPNVFIPLSDTLITSLNDTLKYDWIEINNGITLTLNSLHEGAVFLSARNIIMDGTIMGDYIGYKGAIINDGEGPGKGFGNDQSGVGGFGSGSGAGHGGQGGIGDTNAAGTSISDPKGATYDANTILGIDAGSGGGVGGAFSPNVPGGNGGAGVGLLGAKVMVSGIISVKGETPIIVSSFYGAGGGSGGGIMIMGDYINVTGELHAEGGNGGETASGIFSGGGGGGGRIKFFHSKSYVNTGVNDASAGSSLGVGVEPEDGTVFDIKITSSEPIISRLIIPNQLSLSSSATGNAICNGEILTLTTDLGFSNYDYFKNGSLDRSSVSNVEDFNGVVNGDVFMVETTVAGCIIKSDSKTILVNPDISSSFTHNTNLLTATFTNSSSNGDSYLWDFGDGSTSNAVSPQHTYANTGTYTACLEVSNSVTGCLEDTFCESVIITCPLPITGYEYSGTNWDYTFVDTVSSGSMTWTIDGSNEGNGSNLNYNFTSDGTYEVCQLITNSCGISSSCKNIVVTCSTPTVSFDYNTAEQTVTFTNASDNDLDWSWDFDDTNSSMLQNPVHTFSTPGTYNVCLTGLNSCGNQEIYCESITVLPSSIIQFNKQKKLISIYPNPVKDLFQITGPDQSKYTLKVMSAIGNVIINNTIESGQNISLSHLPEGVYLYILKAEDGIQHIGKLIKEEN